MSRLNTIILTLCLFKLCWLSSECSVVVDSKVGKILGYEDGDMSVFRGIPYGKVERDNPFQAATAYPNFDTTFNASSVVVCPQTNNSIPVGTIHCLTLDIFRPKGTQPNDTLPVMVYISGGEFKLQPDSKAYSPKFLLRYGVIMISINFRQGPYGFLCWKNSKYSNQGMRDVILSLKWIKNNIDSFGGDKENILLFGLSSSAALIELLLFFNTDNLINKAILQSGSAVSPKVLGEYDEGLVGRITKELGYDGDENDVDNVIEFLSEIEINRVVDVSKNETFSPCIDGNLVKKTPKLNRKSNITVMLGTTDREMITFSDLSNTSFFKYYNYKAEIVKGFRNVTDDMVALVKEFYEDGDQVENVVDFGTDYWFNYPIDRCLKFYSDYNITAYRYVFSYVGERNNIKIIDNSIYRGATHGDDMRYIFDLRAVQGSINEEDQTMIDRLTTMWTNFAKYGNPTPATSELLPVEWPPATLDSKPYLLIDSELEVRNRPYQKRMAYWHLYYDRYYRAVRSIDVSTQSN